MSSARLFADYCRSGMLIVGSDAGPNPDGPNGCSEYIFLFSSSVKSVSKLMNRLLNVAVDATKALSLWAGDPEPLTFVTFSTLPTH